jgi:hypothetical protein
MGDYDYCEKHDCSFLMPDLLMCPECAIDRLNAGDVPEPLGDALVEAVRVKDTDIKEATHLLRLVSAEAISEDLYDAIARFVNDHGGF